MQFPRNGVTVCQCKNMVYAIGGHDGHQELKCVERYTYSFLAGKINIQSAYLEREFGCACNFSTLYNCET